MDTDKQFPLLSGTSGRYWLAALLAFAVRSRDRGDLDGFGWAKTRAERVHRNNLRRLGLFPVERAGVVIDEAMLERQIRGANGAGDLERAHQVMENAHANALDASAPATVRLEFSLERARAAMYFGEFRNAETKGMAQGQRFIDSARSIAKDLADKIIGRYRMIGKAPFYFLSEAWSVGSRCTSDLSESERLHRKSQNLKKSYNLLIEKDVSTITDPQSRAILERLEFRKETSLA